MDNKILSEAVQHAEVFKGAMIDKDGRQIIIPFSKGITQEDVLSDTGLAKWYIDNGFNIAFTQGDYEYITKPQFINYRGAVIDKGHKALLRDRLIATITW